MPSAEVAEHWLGAVEALGGGVGFWLLIWLGQYFRKRGEARLQAERSPDVAAGAIGAAFPTIDRVTSQAIVDMRDCIKQIYALMVDRLKHDEQIEEEERIDKRVEKLLAEKLKQLHDQETRGKNASRSG